MMLNFAVMFLLSCMFYIRKSIGIVKIFDFRFLRYLHVLGCLEHDFTIFIKRLSACDKNFVATLEHKIMGGIA